MSSAGIGLPPGAEGARPAEGAFASPRPSRPASRRSVITERPRPKPWLGPERHAHERDLPAGRRSGGWSRIISTVAGFSSRTPFDLALAQQHAGERQIVVGGGDQPAAAAAEGAAAPRVREGDVLQRLGRPSPGRRSPSRSRFSGGTPEVGVVHAERPEDALLQHVAEGLPRSGRPGSPARRWRGCSGTARRADRSAAASPSAFSQSSGRQRRVSGAPSPSSWAWAIGPDGGEAVGEARAVGHQVLDGDVARRGIGVVERPGGVLQHLHAGKLRQPIW